MLIFAIRMVKGQNCHIWHTERRKLVYKYPSKEALIPFRVDLFKEDVVGLFFFDNESNTGNGHKKCNDSLVFAGLKTSHKTYVCIKVRLQVSMITYSATSKIKNMKCGGSAGWTLRSDYRALLISVLAASFSEKIS